ncbi:hypothetical protein RA178_06255 [Shewanella oncorhynchi]|uniref:Uncharacterized protein n=1 Tax=Shewanella oncorhynchi TaxID=2726434 RepID=A0AA50Q4A0_9GAMM|nr:hypothetical protein [Shewanella oncorhynchi]WMB74214.1 hypothetical protein RA178_06255 [Shewanella oncorhynchi]
MIPLDMLSGAIHKTKYGNLEVIEYINKNSVLIRFQNTNYTTTARSSNIRRDKVKDPYSPSVHGVGYLGVGEAIADTREYKLWANMLRRCYCPITHSYSPTYKDCTVSEEWHNFQNFYKDLPKIPNYELWLNNRNYQLDKDIKVEGNKNYSLDSCLFVTSNENVLNGIMKRATIKH